MWVTQKGTWKKIDLDFAFRMNSVNVSRHRGRVRDEIQRTLALCSDSE